MKTASKGRLKWNPAETKLLLELKSQYSSRSWSFITIKFNAVYTTRMRSEDGIKRKWLRIPAEQQHKFCPKEPESQHSSSHIQAGLSPGQTQQPRPRIGDIDVLMSHRQHSTVPFSVPHQLPSQVVAERRRSQIERPYLVSEPIMEGQLLYTDLASLTHPDLWSPDTFVQAARLQVEPQEIFEDQTGPSLEGAL
ncbi:hypothetical protein EV356DRAFT_537226 [Viridothelium virens]|uniref:Myb-like domain-containing protein n=1 Tax=Viridothelium virens TaxID=1048519 RepID=A0A6A6GVB7_VIRVR|nr:hypothetical protein EV356DRAFT_537226 [Viridothelium virens]